MHQASHMFDTPVLDYICHQFCVSVGSVSNIGTYVQYVSFDLKPSYVTPELQRKSRTYFINLFLNIWFFSYNISWRFE